MTTTFPDISINTDRLVLRALEEADAPALAEMMNDEMVAAWTAVPQPYTEDAARGWITEYAPPNAPPLGPRPRRHRVPHPAPRRHRPAQQHELAGPLHRDVVHRRPWARGEGYASEAALATAQWLFGDQKFERLELRTAADNTASQQVAQKIGCISEGVLRNACIARTRTEDGTWAELRTDFIVWGLLPEDLDGVADQLAEAGYSSYTDWS
ncbi:GNAT family N-acetyltransferase [Streptomyces diastatochromogenes]|nr:GNAT family N-acetyltransferase [Streptomyces diastatochromogenes]